MTFEISTAFITNAVSFGRERFSRAMIVFIMFNTIITCLFVQYLLAAFYLPFATSSVNMFYYIMCGYQCDTAVTKNDTCEVIGYHFTAKK